MVYDLVDLDLDLDLDPPLLTILVSQSTYNKGNLTIICDQFTVRFILLEKF